ncbi:MAG: MoaD/ThiS family protein [Spirochaetales bacterium]|nr:MoaD/ThiS family protein [Spirochaetales bacterium]
MIKVILSGSLTHFADGKSSLEIEASTVLEAVRECVDEFPQLAERMLYGAEISRKILVYKDGVDIRLLQGDGTVLEYGSQIKIITILTGG